MKLSGKEGKVYSEQERNDAKQNHANLQSHEGHYRESVTFGKAFLRDLLDTDGCRGIKFELGIAEDGRTTLIPIPVGKHGNELPEDEEEKGMPIRTYDDPPHCPPQC